MIKKVFLYFFLIIFVGCKTNNYVSNLTLIPNYPKSSNTTALDFVNRNSMDGIFIRKIRQFDDLGETYYNFQFLLFVKPNTNQTSGRVYISGMYKSSFFFTHFNTKEEFYKEPLSEFEYYTDKDSFFISTENTFLEDKKNSRKHLSYFEKKWINQPQNYHQYKGYITNKTSNNIILDKDVALLKEFNDKYSGLQIKWSEFRNYRLKVRDRDGCGSNIITLEKQYISYNKATEKDINNTYSLEYLSLDSYLNLRDVFIRMQFDRKYWFCLKDTCLRTRYFNEMYSTADNASNTITSTLPPSYFSQDMNISGDSLIYLGYMKNNKYYISNYGYNKKEIIKKGKYNYSLFGNILPEGEVNIINLNPIYIHSGFYIPKNVDPTYRKYSNPLLKESNIPIEIKGPVIETMLENTIIKKVKFQNESNLKKVKNPFDENRTDVWLILNQNGYKSKGSTDSTKTFFLKKFSK
jgi:hypothetical protein